MPEDNNKKNERHLASLTEEERYRLLVQAVTDYAIFMLDADGYVTSWNPGAQRFKGYTPAEIIGQHFSAFYTPEDREAGLPQRALATAAREGRFISEGWRVRKDGTRFWAAVVLDPIRTPNGELVGFAKVTRDLTERREAQIALERTRDALFQSQKMEAVGKLTGGVAHDFNNLLMVILSALELSRKRLPDDARLKMLQHNAMEAAERGVALTQRMLAFARRQELKVENLDLRGLVNGLKEILERSLSAAVELKVRIPSNLPAIKADPNQLETSILNLVLNARDAMPTGGTIVVTARTETTSGDLARLREPGTYLVLTVDDSGEGMDPQTLARATEPFFTTKGVGKGTGLGLSMVQGMAEQLGGWLDLQSTKGKGTTVSIWLPIANAAAWERESAAAGGAALSDEAANPRTILVVDDDKLVLTNMIAMLEEMGHTVVSASSAKDALSQLRANDRISLVISDHAMPQMTGAELAEAIRGEWPDTPIVLVSGYAELPGGVAANVSRLNKPFSIADLARVIEEQH